MHAKTVVIVNLYCRDRRDETRTANEIDAVEAAPHRRRDGRTVLVLDGDEPCNAVVEVLRCAGGDFERFDLPLERIRDVEDHGVPFGERTSEHEVRPGAVGERRLCRCKTGYLLAAEFARDNDPSADGVSYRIDLVLGRVVRIATIGATVILVFAVEPYEDWERGVRDLALNRRSGLLEGVRGNSLPFRRQDIGELPVNHLVALAEVEPHGIALLVDIQRIRRPLAEGPPRGRGDAYALVCPDSRRLYNKRVAHPRPDFLLRRLSGPELKRRNALDGALGLEDNRLRRGYALRFGRRNPVLAEDNLYPVEVPCADHRVADEERILRDREGGEAPRLRLLRYLVAPAALVLLVPVGRERDGGKLVGRHRRRN